MSTDTTITTPTESTGESITGLTLEAMIESLTGFDEIAIENYFNGFSVYTDGKKQVSRAMRCLVFVHHRREGSTDREAFQTAQGLAFKDLMGYFEQPEGDEDDADLDADLDDPAGKA